MRACAHKFLATVALLLPLLAGGCDGFHGSVIAMTLVWPFVAPTGQVVLLPPGVHLEMWAVGSSKVPVRLAADVGGQDDPSKFSGFNIVPMIDPNEPCMIRGLDHDDDFCENADVSDPTAATICGAHIFTTAAQQMLPGVPDTMEGRSLAEQALVQHTRQVTTPGTVFNAVDGMTTGKAALPLLTLVQYNDPAGEPRSNPALAITPQNAADPAASAMRLQACRAYRDQPPPIGHPYYFVGNPRQYTKPLNGNSFGVFSFSTGPGTMSPMVPNQNLSGITFTVPNELDDITDLLITKETTPNPQTPSMLGLTYQGKRLPDASGGRGVVPMGIAAIIPNPVMGMPPMVVTVGTASILVDLNQRPN